MRWPHDPQKLGERARSLRARALNASTVDELRRVARCLDKTPLPEREAGNVRTALFRRLVEVVRAEQAAEARMVLADGAGFEVAPHHPTEPAFT